MYRLSPLEEKIQAIYTKIGISKPGGYDLETIAEKLKIIVHFMEKKSRGLEILGMGCIIIDSRLSRAEQWEDFCHELGHVLNHVGIQYDAYYLFRELQENQANAFMYHFGVPSFMLNQIWLPPTKQESVQLISEIFNVTHSFALKRLEMHLRKLLSTKYQAFLVQKSIEKEKLAYAQY
ncbi:ImmA/IrrE family metallo-endopeptidase [Bacillus atrophaeus]|uniref:ImmA/IrrE family metallo-endopeptidase n=1 Tax=Bacillus atrophaeus TaxID=1452 RepID=UPI001EFB7C68|nr:ImmA/IrrE family metallo-endopeptidase [Bacillus atrophaeus]MCG8398102.1 ImmA/IrrE family metallo-endopeptidase [Bacillus atrophaeus]